MGGTFDLTGEVLNTGQLNLIPQGVTESTRVGRKCVIKSIQGRGIFTASPAASATFSPSLHMALVLDKQCNGAAAAITDIFTTADMATNLRFLANSSRFVILKRWDWTQNPSAGATTAYNLNKRNFSYFRKCNIPIEFSSTTGVITEIRSNNIFVVGGSDNVAIDDDTVTFQVTWRLKFSDQ